MTPLLPLLLPPPYLLYLPFPYPILIMAAHTTQKPLPGDVPITRQCLVPVTTSSHSAPESFDCFCIPTSSFNAITSNLTNAISDISSTTDPIPLQPSRLFMHKQFQFQPVILVRLTIPSTLAFLLRQNSAITHVRHIRQPLVWSERHHHLRIVIRWRNNSIYVSILCTPSFHNSSLGSNRRCEVLVSAPQ